MAMTKRGTPVPTTHTEGDLLLVAEELKFTLKTASEESCQKALSQRLGRHVEMNLVRTLIAHVKS